MDEYFFQITIKNTGNIKNKIKKQIQSYKDKDVLVEKKEIIKNFSDFIKFLKKDKNTPRILHKTYDPMEIDNGIGQLVVWLQFSGNPEVKLNKQDRQNLKELLYEDNSSPPEFYIEKTNIDNLYLWYENGETSEEFFGTVVNDVFRGFVITHF